MRKWSAFLSLLVLVRVVGAAPASAGRARAVTIDLRQPLEEGAGGTFTAVGPAVRPGTTIQTTGVSEQGEVVFFDEKRVFRGAYGSGTFTFRILAGWHPCDTVAFGSGRLCVGPVAITTCAVKGRSSGRTSQVMAATPIGSTTPTSGGCGADCR